MAEPQRHASVTVIVPTFREAPNLPLLLQRIGAVRAAHRMDLDVLVMDDASADGSVEAVAAFAEPWATIIVRSGKRGLSAAVVDGLERARGEVVVVMDADLSHPPETIPSLVAALQDADIAVGSRYIAGGSTDDDWGVSRWVKSKIATLLARPLTAVRDPMAGFFALRWGQLQLTRNANTLAPIGYKILLELIVRCDVRRVAEIPIHFHDRAHGESKLTMKQELLFLEHLRRLYAFKAAAVVFGSQTNRDTTPSS